MWELNFHLFLISHCPPPHIESEQVIILMKDVTLKLLLAYFTFGHLYYWVLLLLLLDDPLLVETFSVHTQTSNNAVLTGQEVSMTFSVHTQTSNNAVLTGQEVSMGIEHILAEPLVLSCVKKITIFIVVDFESVAIPY